MDTVLRKYFWVVELAAIACCAFLVSSTANTVLGASLRPLPEVPKNDAPTANTAAKQETASSMDEVKKANIFKTPHQEPVKMLDTSVDVVEPDSLDPILSQIKATLVGTVVANDPQWSLAVIVENATHAAGVYGIGSVVQEDYTITKIERKRVTLKHARTIEYLDLDEEKKDKVGSPAAKKSEEPGSGEGIRKLAEGKYVVPQSEIDNTLTNLNTVAMQARIVPNFEGGKANGFKLFSIKPDSIYSKIGLQNGDVIQKINGFEMNSPDKALEIYQKLKDSKHISLDVNRNGKPTNMDYTIR